MTSKKILKYTLCIALLGLGYLAGVFLHPKISDSKQSRQWGDVDTEHLLSQQLVDIKSGQPVKSDTLFSHNRNLLVFWNPVCSFSRQFFNNRLNTREVGVFCFPMTYDMDYTNYIVDKQEIEYPNYGILDSSGIVSVDMPTIKAVPTFVVLDNKGDVIEQKIGIYGIDTLIDHLFK